MSDDKGMFQGGEKGRMFGRFRDAYEDSVFGREPKEEPKDDWDMRAMQAEDAWKNREQNPQEAETSNLMMANRLAQTFDPSSEYGVKALQTYLNRAGVRDYDMKPLAVDGSFGERTESALRKVQEMYARNNQGVSDYGFANTPPPSGVTQTIPQEQGQDYYTNL